MTRPKKHLTSATKSNGISITMPYWDERVEGDGRAIPGSEDRQVSHRHPVRAFRAAPGLVRRGRGARTCSATSSPTWDRPCTGTIGIAPSAQHQPGARVPVAVRAGARLGAGHLGKGIANPIGQIWSGAMMLDHLGCPRSGRGGGQGDRDGAAGRAADARPRRQGQHVGSGQSDRGGFVAPALRSPAA